MPGVPPSPQVPPNVGTDPTPPHTSHIQRRWHGGRPDLSSALAPEPPCFRKEMGPRGLGDGQAPKPGAASCSTIGGGRVMSSGSVMPKHLCTPKSHGSCWGGSQPWQTDGQTDAPRPARFPRAQQELPGTYGSTRQWQMTRRSSEHPGAVGARTGLGGQEGGPQAQRGGFCKVKRRGKQKKEAVLQHK